MQLDCDYYSKGGKNFDGGEDGGDKAIIRMFGVNEAGNSVAAHVHNFTAYFFVHILDPTLEFNQIDIKRFQDSLNSSIHSNNAVI